MIVRTSSNSREGAAYFFNPIRQGSVATKESVIDLYTGKPLQFEEVDAAVARASGLVRGKIADDRSAICLWGGGDAKYCTKERQDAVLAPWIAYSR